MRSSSRCLAFSCALALASLAASCSSPAPGEDDVGFAAAWLTPEGQIPESVEFLEVVRLFPDGTQQQLFTRSRTGVLEDGNLVVPSLPTDQPVELELRGLDAAQTGLLFVGRSGPVVLGAGERRFVRVAMYPVSAAVDLDRGDPMPRRLLHTATELPDGRVLVAGGFTEIDPIACPSDLSLPMGTVCWELTASDDAYLFEPATARFFPVEGGMLAARGGHTATALEDGRVLLAGGASTAILAASPVGDPVSGREIAILPRDAAGEGAAHAHLELFEPEANAEAEDLERDGDAGRGLFVGDPSEGARSRAPIPLNEARFFHAAALTPHDGNQVLLAGGIGNGGDPSTSYSVFDARKPGGPGVYDNSGNTALGTRRVAPAALALGSGDEARVWIFGGALSTANNGELADVWAPDAMDPNGTLAPAADETNFPNPLGPADDRPEYALIRPSVASFEDGAYGLVTGWYGPRCPAGMPTAAPIFPAAGDADVLCGHQGGLDRSFTVRNEDGVTTRTQPPSSTRHAFGDAVTLRDGRVMIAGGVSDSIFQENLGTVVYSQIASDRASGALSVRIGHGRFFHASAPLFDSGALLFGGVTLSLDGSTLSFTDEDEAVLLLPMERPDAMPPAMDDGAEE